VFSKPTNQPTNKQTNNQKVNFTGNKWKDKLYRWHTGYPGGLKQRTAHEMLQRQPENILKKAILGMLSRNNLRHKFIEPRLKIYTGPNHPHQGQLGDMSMGIAKDGAADSTAGADGDGTADGDANAANAAAEVLPKHPRSRQGDYHYGFEEGKYAARGSYQHGKNSK
jgi:hypothetical protein